MCLVCSAFCSGRLCRACHASLGRVPPRLVAADVVARSAFLHEAAARLLVHRLKYQAILEAGSVLAAFMIPLIPSGAAALVPVPRSLHRRLTLGIDPAVELARRISRVTGIPVTPVLRPPPISGRHAGRAKDRRGPPAFGMRARPASGSVLIDDVVTTGSTLGAAAGRMGGTVMAAVTATAVPPMTSVIEGERGPTRSRLGLQMED